MVTQLPTRTLGDYLPVLLVALGVLLVMAALLVVAFHVGREVGRADQVLATLDATVTHARLLTADVRAVTALLAHACVVAP
jgi:hypothetical protein